MSYTRIQKASAKLLTAHPFFATLFLTSTRIETRDIDTLMTNGASIWYNPDFLETLPSLDVVVSALAHEVMHIADGHCEPGNLQGRDPNLLNMAQDYRINWLLHKCGFKLGEGWLLDEEFADMSIDQIYRVLDKRHPPKKQQPGSSGQPQGQPKPGKGNGTPQPDPGQPREGLPNGGIGRDVEVPKGVSPDEAQAQKASRKQKVAQAQMAARMAGKMPADLDRWINGLLDPKVPWQDYLADYLKSRSNEDESWNRRNRRFNDVYLPAKFSLTMGPIGIIGDTSGSISDEENIQNASEAAAIGEEMRPERMHVLWADTKVAGEEVYEPGDPWEFKPKGGGGTDMRVPLKYIEQYEPDVVVLFTDGETPWPKEEPPYDLIVCCTTNAKVPFGRVIRM